MMTAARFDYRYFALFGLKAVDEDQGAIALEGTFDACREFWRRHGLTCSPRGAEESRILRDRSRREVGRFVPADGEEPTRADEWIIGVEKAAIGIRPDGA